MNYQFPINKWTVSALVALVAVFGSDLVGTVLNAISLLSGALAPAQ